MNTISPVTPHEFHILKAIVEAKSGRPKIKLIGNPVFDVCENDGDERALQSCIEKGWVINRYSRAGLRLHSLLFEGLQTYNRRIALEA